jgi:hypothetical protein
VICFDIGSGEIMKNVFVQRIPILAAFGLASLFSCEAISQQHASSPFAVLPPQGDAQPEWRPGLNRGVPLSNTTNTRKIDSLPKSNQSALTMGTANIKERLKAANLDPADPDFAVKQKTKMLNTTSAYIKAHVNNIKINIKRREPQKLFGDLRTYDKSRISNTNSTTGQSNSVDKSKKRAISTIKVPAATFVNLFEISLDLSTVLPNPNLISSERLYLAQFVSAASPQSLLTSVSFNGCSSAVTFNNVLLNISSDFQKSPFLSEFKDSNGLHYYYLLIWGSEVSLGASPHDMTVSLQGPLQASFSYPAISPSASATIQLTVDSNPSLNVSADSGIKYSNVQLAMPNKPRLDPATNPIAVTTGEDILGFGVNLGSGWKVKSARIVAAHSVLDSPGINTSEDFYRGASISQMPSDGRLQTLVHWHYGFAESISYTIEWELEGPSGQRPLMTMPLSGPCDS